MNRLDTFLLSMEMMIFGIGFIGLFIAQIIDSKIFEVKYCNGHDDWKGTMVINN